MLVKWGLRVCRLVKLLFSLVVLIGMFNCYHGNDTMVLSKQTKLAMFFMGLMGLALSLSSSAIFAAQTASIDSFLQKSFGDLKEDLESAKSNKKKGVVLFFEQNDCPFCHRMKTAIFTQVKVQNYYNKNFLIFSVDIKQSDEITDFHGKSTTQKKLFSKIAKFRGATPVIAFFDLEGKLVTRYTGATSNAQEFLWLGEYVVSKKYKTMSFTKYKLQKKRAARAK